MSPPLAIDLFSGLGGWTEGLLAEGYRVIGFDNHRHVYGDAKYPGDLVLQDVLTLHGRQFKDAALIVASPPCQAYSYRAMPWKRAKALPPPDNALFEACFRIQAESIEAAGHFIPLVVENVCGAQKWVGRARWHYGSFYLWGDVPALMPIVTKKPIKCGHLNWDQFGTPGYKGDQLQDKATKVSGLNWSGSDKSGYKAQAFNGTAEARLRHGTKVPGLKHGRLPPGGLAQGGDWFNSEQPSISRQCGSKSSARQAASAQIAKIPIGLSRHIARSWKPE